jgi:acetyl esterase/lipase
MHLPLCLFTARTLVSILSVGLLASGGCTAFDILNAPVPSCGYVRTSDIAYGPLPRQKLDVYRPRHTSPDARVVIFFYGGDWQEGQKGDYRFAAEALTSKGFIAVLPDYRIYPEAQFPEFIADAAMSVRWTHDHIDQFGGDPTHLYLMGHSAGAYIAVILTLDGHYLKEVGLDRGNIRGTVGMAGPYDFVPSGTERAIFNMAPGQQKPDPRMEPVNFVDRHAPPMLLMQGLDDELVDPVNAFELAARIKSAGGDVQLIAYPHTGHKELVAALAWEFRWLAPVRRDAADFLRKH